MSASPAFSHRAFPIDLFARHPLRIQLLLTSRERRIFSYWSSVIGSVVIEAHTKNHPVAARLQPAILAMQIQTFDQLSYPDPRGRKLENAELKIQ